jgi:site-specific DNA recombinase
MAQRLPDIQNGLMRAAIYARYSSENQRDASIEDQIEVCRRYAERQGWQVVELYDDRAASGASALSRRGYQRMLLDAEASRFDMLVCEAIDRLGRKLSDIADLFDRLSFRRIAIHATSLGQVTQMHVGIMGTMAQMTLSDLREKTKRGQLGRARLGRIPGGLAFGYDVVPAAVGAKEAGERSINQAEAEIVRRIFRDYANDKSPRGIARELNEQAVPGPGGREWGDTTIRGQADRGTGLLNNTLYVGRLSWNRCSYVKDPSTGCRVARVNPQDQWEEVDVPALRIVDQDLWDAVKARQASMTFDMPNSNPQELNGLHRMSYLLSGVLACGCCGGGYTITGKDRYGCATRRAKGTCGNSRTITRQRIETRVLAALQDRMLTPELVEEFVRAFNEEITAGSRQAAAEADQVTKELSQIERKLAGVVRAIEDGNWNDTLKVRLAELEQSKVKLTARLIAAATPAPRVHLHPNAAGLYRDKVANLQEALNAPDIRPEATQALRSLIEKVVLMPDPDAPDGLRAELHGDLAVLLSLTQEQPPLRRSAHAGAVAEGSGTCVPQSLLSVVAGTGFEPVTFRL